MITAEIYYNGELRTSCTHVQSGTSITTDAPTDNHGKGEAFSPTDLLSTSLVACMLTTMGIMARKEQIPFEKARASMEKIMANNPRRVAEIIISITISTNGLTEEQRRKLEQAAIYCPVARSLHPDVNQQVKFEYV